MTTILLLEDDAALRIGLSYDLEAEGYNLIVAETIEEGREVVANNNIDLAILDVDLPDGNGFDFCIEIKKLKSIPVIFLTACDLIKDEVKGFECGADDYVTKPFSNILLRKRIEAVLRRGKELNKGQIYQDNNLIINFEKLVAHKTGEKLMLTPTEFKLLNLLVSNKGNVVTRQLIIDKIWDDKGNFVDEHALTVNINRLRNKLEDDNHKYIKTIYGLGYTWVGEDCD